GDRGRTWQPSGPASVLQLLDPLPRVPLEALRECRRKAVRRRQEIQHLLRGGARAGAVARRETRVREAVERVRRARVRLGVQLEDRERFLRLALPLQDRVPEAGG